MHELVLLFTDPSAVPLVFTARKSHVLEAGIGV